MLRPALRILAEAAELWSGVTALTWALFSTIGGEHLDRPSMQVLLLLAGEDFWRAAAFTLGVAQVVFLVFNQRHSRGLTAVLMCSWWCALTAGIWSATGFSGSIAVNAGWAGINSFLLVRHLSPPRYAAWAYG